MCINLTWKWACHDLDFTLIVSVISNIKLEWFQSPISWNWRLAFSQMSTPNPVSQICLNWTCKNILIIYRFPSGDNKSFIRFYRAKGKRSTKMTIVEKSSNKESEEQTSNVLQPGAVIRPVLSLDTAIIIIEKLYGLKAIKLKEYIRYNHQSPPHSWLLA